MTLALNNVQARIASALIYGMDLWEFNWAIVQCARKDPAKVSAENSGITYMYLYGLCGYDDLSYPGEAMEKKPPFSQCDGNPTACYFGFQIVWIFIHTIEHLSSWPSLVRPLTSKNHPNHSWDKCYTEKMP